MKPKSLSLVTIASAVVAHIVEYLAVFHVESHHREIFSFIQKFFGVAFFCYIDRQGCTSPECADASPANGHGIAFLLVASCKQLSVVEPLETVLCEVLSHVELLETVLFLSKCRSDRHHHNGCQCCDNSTFLHIRLV